MEKTVEKIIDLIRKDNAITRDKIAEEIGISIKGIDYHIEILKKENVIERKESRKSGYWILKKNSK